MKLWIFYKSPFLADIFDTMLGVEKGTLSHYYHSVFISLWRGMASLLLLGGGGSSGSLFSLAIGPSWLGGIGVPYYYSPCGLH